MVAKTILRMCNKFHKSLTIMTSSQYIPTIIYELFDQQIRIALLKKENVFSAAHRMKIQEVGLFMNSNVTHYFFFI